MVKLVDLSLDIYDGAPTFDPDPKTSIRPHLGVGDLGYNMSQVIMSSHFGTHLDAPFHFFDDGETVDQLDLRRGLGPALVIDLRHKERKEEITVEDLEGCVPPPGYGSRIILQTGWDRQYPHPHYFSDQPFLGLAACQWLVDRGVSTVAMDMPTIFPASYIEAHHILLGAKVLIIEGLTHLDRLTTKQVILMALPLRIRGRDGSPCRAVALQPADDAEWELLAALYSNLDE